VVLRLLGLEVPLTRVGWLPGSAALA
jgi:hypothetical protein